MGETGCGKTRLIRYMCGLQAGPEGPRNMLLVKVSWSLDFEYFFSPVASELRILVVILVDNMF